MDHLREAQRAIGDAHRRSVYEHTMAESQIAIAHALVAMVERLDEMIKSRDLKRPGPPIADN